MLREIQGVRQDNPGLKRRWYQDYFFDLYTWHSPDGALAGFQLCYDVRGRERVLSWRRQYGFSHNRIDSGEDANVYPMTPILVADGRFPHRLVRQRFNRHGATLDAPTRTTILDKMREYGRSVARGVISLPRTKRRIPPPSTPA
jgi:hypothetical protein